MIAALVVLVIALLSAGSGAHARRTSCGRHFGTYYVAVTCSFEATGSRVYVQATGIAPVTVTYSLLTPLFPGDASVDVKLATSNGTVVAACRRASLVAAACSDESASKIPRGTMLTCTFEGYKHGVGVLDYLCSNRDPR